MSKDFTIPRCVSAPPLFGPDKPWLAPLAGYSDLPFRLLCREYGAATCETEMISAKGLFYKTPGTTRLLSTAPSDLPLVPQLFGAEPGMLAYAVRVLLEAGHCWFDLNMGCSVRKVMRQNAGAALLADPDLSLAIARAMIDEVRKTGISGGIGFKLRLGVDPSRPVLPDLALRLEDAGAAWLAVHPRFASQGFQGRPNREVIAVLTDRLAIPLLASGDLFEADDGITIIRQTGCAGVMYARGALRNPAIFAAHRNILAGVAPERQTPAELRQMIERHVFLARQYGGVKKPFVKMRSLIPRYARLSPGVGELRKNLCACESWEDLDAALDSFMEYSIANTNNHLSG